MIIIKSLITLLIIWFLIICILILIGSRFSQKTEPYGPNFFENSFCLMTLPIALSMNKYIHSERGEIFTKKLPYKPRFINWIWACWGGYFWLPCPICDELLGGHEPRGTLMKTRSTGTGVCRNCINEARERNIAKYKEWGWGNK